MKQKLTFLAALLLSGSLFAQNFAADTLIIERVIGDPIQDMLIFPSGNDVQWINYDEDLAEGLCVINGEETPIGWFSEVDFSFLNPLETDNYAFTSCSYLFTGERNHNWLILPPIFIPDETYHFFWRSLTYEGPAFTDGYKVMASTAGNLPDEFSTELFKAAEMIKPVVANQYTLNPADYVFSNGYIHANGFTDTNYYFFNPPDGPLRGKLEPHSVSLAPFAGQTIYLAFHHDSRDDSQLQIDDILVAKELSSPVQPTTDWIQFQIIPNPAGAQTYINWQMKKPEPGRLLLIDQQGKTVLQKSFSAYEQGSLFLELEHVTPGVYECVLQTELGRVSKRLVRL
ncbi:MAG: T9SS type A sorting domain-containing protein [Saprospiraceae bacterium]|nr:T9SS type A sorting domain-containing protein [Saprospiraceae bacterium]